jgi:hypothetical protein
MSFCPGKDKSLHYYDFQNDSLNKLLQGRYISSLAHDGHGKLLIAYQKILIEWDESKKVAKDWMPIVEERFKLKNYLFAETLQKLANDEMTLMSREIALENEKIELKRLRAEVESDFSKRRGDMFKIIEIYKDKADKIDKEFARVLAFENEVIEKRKQDVFKNIEIKSKLEKEPYRSEWTVYDEDIKLVGNIDLVFIDKDNNYCILDYKRMLEPENNAYGKQCLIIDYEHTDKVKHMLQLNIYKYMLENKYGIRIDKLYNAYIIDDKFRIVKQDIINIKREVFDKL